MIEPTSDSPSTPTSRPTAPSQGAAGGGFAWMLLDAAQAQGREDVRGARDVVRAMGPERRRRGPEPGVDLGKDPLMAQVAAQTDATKLASAELASAGEAREAPTPRARAPVGVRAAAPEGEARRLGRDSPAPTGRRGAAEQQNQPSPRAFAPGGVEPRVPVGAASPSGRVGGEVQSVSRPGAGGAGSVAARGASVVGAGRSATSAHPMFGARPNHAGRTHGGAKAAPAPATPARTPEQALRAQAMRGLAGVLRHKGGTVTMKLSPDALGELRVQMRLEGSRVEARIEAGSERARELLEGEMPALRAALESQGLVVQRLELAPAEPGAMPPGTAGLVRRGEAWSSREARREREEPSSLAEPGDVEFVWLDGRVDRMA